MAALHQDVFFTLPFPAEPSRRIAALEQKWSRYEGVKVFGQQHWRNLKAFEPDILVASLSVLKRLAEEPADVPEVSCALFVITQLGAPPLTEEDRDLFWNAFDVPVWELLVEENGQILGHECELHEGWHLNGTLGAMNELYEGCLDGSPCPCGRPSPRFIALTRKPLVRTVTASASQ